MSSPTPENPVTIEQSHYDQNDVLFRVLYLATPRRWNNSTYVIDIGVAYSQEELKELGEGNAKRGEEMAEKYLRENQRSWEWLQALMVADIKPSLKEIQAHAAGK